MWNLNFITKKDFKSHVKNTIANYGDKLKPYDVKRFNNNIVDPVKLIFDKNVYNYSWEEIIKNEIFRQRYKANSNEIGYFHQKIFKYIKGCTVPERGWDVIVSSKNGLEVPECGTVKTVYIEMKNKHNTMNSASSSKTYMKMQGQLLSDDNCACFLVEVIAKKSQNIPWIVSLDGRRQRHKFIRRVSMDEFYKFVTGDPDAFYKMCMVLPSVIQEVVASSHNIQIPRDTVFDELRNMSDENGSFILALYMLGFAEYNGFKKCE
ncbi:MAG: Eco47II family restriction endonuclease [Synergistaceae bacterium]|nr:Eco47II family restriction endonuclease [Synergistaceae bacterium]